MILPTKLFLLFFLLSQDDSPMKRLCCTYIFLLEIRKAQKWHVQFMQFENAD